MHVRMLVLLASLALLLALPASAGGPGWTGTWDSTTGAGNEYDFTFTQSGSGVTGYYVRGGQTEQIPIKNGVVNGDVLTFESDEAYDYEFTMSPDGNSFTGKWGYLTAPGTYTGGTYTGERRVPEAADIGQVVVRLRPCTGVGDVTQFTITRKRDRCRQYGVRGFMKNEDNATRESFRKNGYKIYLEDVMPGGSFDNTQFGPGTCTYGSYPLRRTGGKTCLITEGFGGRPTSYVDLGVRHDNKFKGTLRYRATVRKGDGTLVKRSNVAKVVVKGPWRKRRG